MSPLPVDFSLDPRKIQGMSFNNNFSDASCEALSLKIRLGAGDLSHDETALYSFSFEGHEYSTGTKIWCIKLHELGIVWMPSKPRLDDFEIGESTEGNSKNIWSITKGKPIAATCWIPVIAQGEPFNSLQFQKLNSFLNENFVKVAKSGLELMRNDRILTDNGKVVPCAFNTVHFDSDYNANRIWTLEELLDSWKARNAVDPSIAATMDPGHSIPDGLPSFIGGGEDESLEVEHHSHFDAIDGLQSMMARQDEARYNELTFIEQERSANYGSHAQHREETYRTALECYTNLSLGGLGASASRCAVAPAAARRGISGAPAPVATNRRILGNEVPVAPASRRITGAEVPVVGRRRITAATSPSPNVARAVARTPGSGRSSGVTPAPDVAGMAAPTTTPASHRRSRVDVEETEASPKVEQGVVGTPTRTGGMAQAPKISLATPKAPGPIKTPADPALTLVMLAFFIIGCLSSAQMIWSWKQQVFPSST